MKVSSRVIKLKAIMEEDGVMLEGKRISMAPITTDAMNPMIIPKDHHITTILIRNIHEVYGHCGVEQALSITKEQFWAVKAKKLCSLPKTDGPEDVSADGTVAQSTSTRSVTAERIISDHFW